MKYLPGRINQKLIMKNIILVLTGNMAWLPFQITVQQDQSD